MATTGTVIVFDCRCGVCRRRSRRASAEAERGLTPILGRLRVYADNPLAAVVLRFGIITIDGERYEDDGFYASFDRMIKSDGYSHQHEIAWSRSQGQPPPPRKRLEDFRWRPGIDIKGRWIGTQLREKCRRGHRINVNRGDLRQLVEEANPEQTVYLG